MPFTHKQSPPQIFFSRGNRFRLWASFLGYRSAQNELRRHGDGNCITFVVLWTSVMYSTFCDVFNLVDAKFPFRSVCVSLLLSIVECHSFPFSLRPHNFWAPLGPPARAPLAERGA
jgi:hypothetical protein